MSSNLSCLLNNQFEVLPGQVLESGLQEKSRFGDKATSPALRKTLLQAGVLTYIFRDFLPFKDYHRIRLCCKNWEKACRAPSFLFYQAQTLLNQQSVRYPREKIDHILNQSILQRKEIELPQFTQFNILKFQRRMQFFSQKVARKIQDNQYP